MIIFFITKASENNPANSGKYGDITVIIENLDCDNGVLLSQLFYLKFNDKTDFPIKSDKAYRSISAKINNKMTTFVFENVPYGTYALCAHHDINNNHKMDKTFLGFPAEPYGLSNNPTIYFTVPTFDDCKFEVNKKNTEIRLIMKK